MNNQLVFSDYLIFVLYLTDTGSITDVKARNTIPKDFFLLKVLLPGGPSEQASLLPIFLRSNSLA
jgi:hypothetical protein